MTVSMEEYLELLHRVEKLEKQQQEYEDKELDWAMAQFNYLSKTPDERKAWSIICNRLGKKKTTLRVKTYLNVKGD